MIVNEIHIKQFRGFNEVQFELGQYITVISGRNGTLKSTLLGILTQPFTITDQDNPLYLEKPLCGGTYKSGFSDKFKLSTEHDKVGEHEWTLKLTDDTDFTVESIKRTANSIRFWKKGSREKGTGYVQRPVIFLSLQRLLPLGEAKNLKTSDELNLTAEEVEFYLQHHSDILMTRDNVQAANYIKGVDKTTMGVSADNYDWQSNSAGQDNLGKILLAILSFKRLNDTYPEHYNGGILAIDELDATLYPGAQSKLFKFLYAQAKKLKIQIIFTTHSLTLLKDACDIQSDPRRSELVKVVYLKKEDSFSRPQNGVTYQRILHNLNRTCGEAIANNDKLPVFTEDKEAQIFVKALLKRNFTKLLDFNNVSLGCGNYLELASKKVIGFKYPDSLIILDGDLDAAKKRKAKKLGNVILLPKDGKSPEQLLAEYLQNLSDKSSVWSSISVDYDHATCFDTYSYREIMEGKPGFKARDIAKLWFNEQKHLWGAGCCRVINPWITDNEDSVESFIADFIRTYNAIAKRLGNMEIEPER